MLTVEKIVDSLRITRREFGDFFLQVQVEKGIPVTERKLFEAVATAADDSQAFTEALNFLKLQGWLETFVDIIVFQGREDGRLAQFLAESVGDADTSAELQAMINVARGFDQPEIIYRGYANGIRWTGKIFINGHFSGTGVLVGPHLVLTAWHVVRALFTPAPDLTYQPNVINSGDLEIEFDDYLTMVNRGQSLRPVRSLRVAAKDQTDWCVVFSPCHHEELANRLPADLTELDGFWDYAILRLSQPPGLERSHARPDIRALVPGENNDIFLFQHPAGQPLKSDRGPITHVDPPVDPKFIPRLRFLHSVNALGGSSGGPCFDKSFTLFGLHQGVWNKGAAGAALPTNRGIPITRIIDHYTREIENLPPLDPAESPVWRLSETQGSLPVIGCDDFQAAVWRSVTGAKPRLFSISGEKGGGKSFRIELLEAMLPEGGHLKVNLEAESISKLEALELAEKICATAGAAIEQITPVAAINSTRAVWLKDEVVHKVIAGLNNVRNNRLVWISLKNLNHFKIEKEDANELLLLLYEKLKTVDWLRIVLDGSKDDIPFSLTPLIEEHRVSKIDADDIKTYLNRFLVNLQLPIPPDNNSIMATIRGYLRDYDRDLTRFPENPTLAIEELSRRIMNWVNDYIDDNI